jgi:hypothetical protein
MVTPVSVLVSVEVMVLAQVLVLVTQWPKAA